MASLSCGQNIGSYYFTDGKTCESHRERERERECVCVCVITRDQDISKGRDVIHGWRLP